MIQIRAARAEDAEQLVDLIALLEHRVDAAGISRRIAALSIAGIPQLSRLRAIRSSASAAFT